MEWILEVATTGTGAEEPYDFTRLAWLGDAAARLRGPCGLMPSLALVVLDVVVLMFHIYIYIIFVYVMYIYRVELL